jgi:hypothetical protein
MKIMEVKPPHQLVILEKFDLSMKICLLHKNLVTMPGKRSYAYSRDFAAIDLRINGEAF